MHDFWDTHSGWFILGMLCFPRLTMLFFTSYGSGFLYWAGWLFVPQLTVAVIAIILYGETNSGVDLLTWIWALICLVSKTGGDHD